MVRPKMYSDDDNERIKRLYTKDRESLSAIARMFNYSSPEIVKRKLESMGVRIRNRSAAMKAIHKKRREDNNE